MLSLLLSLTNGAGYDEGAGEDTGAGEEGSGSLSEEPNSDISEPKSDTNSIPSQFDEAFLESLTESMS